MPKTIVDQELERILKLIIEFGQAAEGKDAFETQMILNHKAAIEYLVMNIDSEWRRKYAMHSSRHFF